MQTSPPCAAGVSSIGLQIALYATRSPVILDNEMEKALKNAENQLESSIAQALVNGKNLMLQIISAKGRKMDVNTIAVLDELLKVYPEDYWLNFVKNKTK